MKRLLIAAFHMLAPCAAMAQAQFPTAGNPAVSVGSGVMMCLNAAGQAVPLPNAACPPGGGGGGTVTQGPAGASPWPVFEPNGATPAPSQVSCANSSTALLAADTTKVARLLINVSAVTIFIGPSGVTTTTGTPWPAGSGLDLSHFTGALFCVVSTGAALAGVLQY